MADATFERRITLAAGDRSLATLYLGTSPGMRQVHARAADQDAIYSVDLATYEVPVKAEEWIDNTVLEIPAGDIHAIDVAGLRLQRVTEPASETKDSASAAKGTATAAKSTWQVTGAAAGETLHAEAADNLAGLLANLQIGAVLGKDDKPEYGLDKPLLKVSLTAKEGKEIDYRIGKMKDGNAYALKVSTRPEYFRLPDYTAKPLLDAAEHRTLLAAAPAAEKAAAKAATSSTEQKPASKAATEETKG